MKNIQVQKAIDAFKKEHLNCAQSILRGFEDKYQIEAEIFNRAKA